MALLAMMIMLRSSIKLCSEVEVAGSLCEMWVGLQAAAHPVPVVSSWALYRDLPPERKDVQHIK